MKSYLKNLPELQKIGDEILDKYNKDNPYYEVDIDDIVERCYDIRIEGAPLKWEHGVEGYPCLGGHKIFIDSGLMNDDRQERRYRFTLAEEFAHIILHRDIWKNVNTPEEWAEAWTKLPDDVHNKLDNNAKELAGIILLPRFSFINRAVQIRDSLCTTFGYELLRLSDMQKDEIKNSAIKVLADNFNVSTQSCEIRMERIERYFRQSLFDMTLKSQYLKKVVV
jgi:Zn-dependent peptidase ImmA (M78 family)